MRRPFLVPPAVLAAVLSIAATPAPLSDPVGVYALIDRVVVEPDAANPRTIQIWGVFALSDGRPGDNYQPPQRGYLHYAVNPRNERATLAEWADMRAVAGTGKPLGFGGRYEALGRVRRPVEAAGNPDTYPLGFGVVSNLTGHYRTAIEYGLARVPAPLSPADGGRVAAGQMRFITRNVADPAVRYVFEVRGQGEHEASEPLAPGRGETTWSPRLRLRAGQTYTWSVHVIAGDWSGAPASATFTVGQ